MNATTAIATLNATFDRIKHSSDPATRFAFGKALLESGAPEYLDYHYGLIELNDCNTELFELICRKFGQRGDVGENYLLARIETETNDRVKATALQILGSFRYASGKRLHQTAQYARSFLASANPELRLHAIWVMGWVGADIDFDQLAQVLRTDPDPKIRGSSGTAMMQIFFNDKRVAAVALVHLEHALMSEADWGALEHILISIQEISGKKLGLNATARQPASREQVEQAKQKAEKFFNSYVRQ